MGCVSSTLTYRTETGLGDDPRPVFFRGGDCGVFIHNILIINHLQNVHLQTHRKNQGSADAPFATH